MKKYVFLMLSTFLLGACAPLLGNGATSGKISFPRTCREAPPFTNVDFDRRAEATNKYDKKAGDRVLASFFGPSNGAYSFLTETAEKLKLSQSGNKRLSKINVCDARKIKRDLLEQQISDYATTLKAGQKTVKYRLCMLKTIADKNQPGSLPKLEQVAALCAIEKGFLQK